METGSLKDELLKLNDYSIEHQLLQAYTGKR